jgi:predicted metal-dependent hydrolase
MNFGEAHEAIEDARRTMRHADSVVSQLAGLCAGRLRAAGVSGYVLKQLKRELADYNIHTSSWKD